MLNTRKSAAMNSSGWNRPGETVVGGGPKGGESEDIRVL